MVEWLDFVPVDQSQKQLLPPVDESPSRPMPTSQEFLSNPYDPVVLIDGSDTVPGLFDKGSWVIFQAIFDFCFFVFFEHEFLYLLIVSIENI